MATLSLHQVTKQFRGRAAVCGVDVEIASGEFFAVLGPSGCGKTTLLRLIEAMKRRTADPSSSGDATSHIAIRATGRWGWCFRTTPSFHR